MWTLFNRTPFAGDRNWIRDKSGVHWWIVGLRATCTFSQDGRLRLADEQLPPLLAPEYFGAPGESSLRYDSDLLAVKPTTDILVVGSAHAPGGKRATEVPVSLRIGQVHKRLVVYGERFYRMGPIGLQPSAATPFTTCPIRYELAFGGRDFSDPDPRNHRMNESNPVGRGTAHRLESLIDKPAHRIEYTGRDNAGAAPAGFGPIDGAWMPRRALAGTYDSRWAATKAPLLPDDYDPAFALSSPMDQRVAAPLAGGERLELTNLTPSGHQLIDVPRVALEFTARFGVRRVPQPFQLATVLVEPDDRRVSFVWQSTLRVPAPDVDYLDGTEIVERRGVK